MATLVVRTARSLTNAQLVVGWVAVRVVNMQLASKRAMWFAHRVPCPALGLVRTKERVQYRVVVYVHDSLVIFGAPKFCLAVTAAPHVSYIAFCASFVSKV